MAKSPRMGSKAREVSLVNRPDDAKNTIFDLNGDFTKTIPLSWEF